MDEETVSLIKLIADLGGTVIVTVMLYVVWQRLNDVTDNVLALLLLLAKREMGEDSLGDNESSTESLLPARKKAPRL